MYALHIFSEHLNSPPAFSEVRVTRSLVLHVCFVDRCLSFCTFSFAIVLSVLLRYTDSDYPFGIFKFFFSQNYFFAIHSLLMLQNINHVHHNHLFCEYCVHCTYLLRYCNFTNLHRTRFRGILS